jgi:hypothetical protein
MAQRRHIILTFATWKTCNAGWAYLERHPVPGCISLKDYTGIGQRRPTTRTLGRLMATRQALAQRALRAFAETHLALSPLKAPWSADSHPAPVRYPVWVSFADVAVAWERYRAKSHPNLAPITMTRLGRLLRPLLPKGVERQFTSRHGRLAIGYRWLVLKTEDL